MGPMDDPFAAGVSLAVSRTKEADFVGREALEWLRDEPRDRRLVSVHLSGSILWGGESVILNNERMGHISSAALAPSLGGSAGLAWIRGEPERDGWEVESRGKLAPIRLRTEPWYDPSGERLRE